MKTLIIYHEIKPGVACPDGISAAWVTKQKYTDADLIGASYNGDIPDIDGYERVIVVDFSFSIDILNRWLDTSKVMVIDHHKTAMQDLSQFKNAIFAMEESGATLAWLTHFPNKPMPAFLSYVKDRDLWNFALPFTEEIHEAMSFIGRKLHQLDFLATLSQSELTDLLKPIGEKLLEPKRNKIKKLASTAQYYSVLSHKILAVEVPEQHARLVSDLCAYLYKLNPDVPFIAAYTSECTDEKYGISFRSDKNGSNFDVSEVAKHFGGGGHRNASGATVKKLKDIFELMV